MECCGLFARQMKGLANADVKNYTINFTSSSILLLVGAVAKLEGATYTSYAAWLFAVGMGALGTREFVTSYVKPNATTINNNNIKVIDKSDDEDMHSAEDESQAKMKKSL